ncbi:CoA transferase [Alkalilacustris brevis]|uniref:CoA transferase n=1 Tax=Alkalilacustris brevis TaxID=2026338 RepID=UPI000E0D8E0F|nr:CoA transferase [Alkalilacustris brevis]
MSIANSRIILDGLLAAAGFEDAPLERLEIIDDGNALPTPWPITANAVAVLAAVGLAASRLQEMRGGGLLPVRLSTRHAGLAMANSNYLTVAGARSKFRDPFTGFYEAANGRWVFLHGNFPHLREGVVRLLGASSAGDVAARVRSRDAFALEAEGIAAGLCVAAVRTREEWRAEAQHDAVRKLPLIEMTQLDDTPARRLGAGDSPLQGVRMLDLSRVIAGPMCGRTIAEWGGDVLLVSGPGLPSIESLVIDTGFGKRAAEIDLNDTQGQARFDTLVQGANIFLDAYRPGSLPARGLDAVALARLRPGLVHVELDAFGRAGPWSPRRGYDSLVQATVGMCWDGVNPPRNLPCQPLDYLSGYLAALAAMVGLIRQLEVGGSRHARLSLTRTAEWMWDTHDQLGPEAEYPQARPTADELRAQGLLATHDTDFGPIEALRPPLQPAGWTWPRPPCRLGRHSAEWVD